MKLVFLFLAMTGFSMTTQAGQAALSHYPNCANSEPGRAVEFKGVGNLDVVSLSYPSGSTVPGQIRPSFIYNYVIQGVHPNENGQAVIYGSLIDSKSEILNNKTSKLREAFIVDPNQTVEIGFKETAIQGNYDLKIKIQKVNQHVNVVDILDGAKGSLQKGPLGKDSLSFELRKGLVCEGMAEYLKYVIDSSTGNHGSAASSASTTSPSEKSEPSGS